MQEVANFSEPGGDLCHVEKPCVPHAAEPGGQTYGPQQAAGEVSTSGMAKDVWVALHGGADVMD